ncbi:hypothetical protein [Ruegeria meonggei]|uniref:hypothetical protein n=1 Tax=Ruegeria meonggei TaxID=1446476 RepID=UPI0013566ECE|nr:hypothetical protein [Ruegeria meonggei]
MATAYFITASILCLCAYHQTRTAARNIRDARGTLGNPLDRGGQESGHHKACPK